jgi:hypothetical protein
MMQRRPAAFVPPVAQGAATQYRRCGRRSRAEHCLLHCAVAGAPPTRTHSAWRLAFISCKIFGNIEQITL